MTNEEYIKFISQEPTPEMIEEGSGYKFIKKVILKKELLKLYNGHTRFEIKEMVIGKNGMWGTGVFHYKHPVTNEWLSEAGAAAIPFSKGIKLDFPALKTAIFKNAVKEIGPWFGLELNSDNEEKELHSSPPVTVNMEQTIDDQVKEVMDNLEKIEFKEDASNYLNSTSFKHLIPAKNIVNKKPSKQTA